jgi:hypothetical protein
VAVTRATLNEIVEAVGVVDVFITVHPGYPLVAAVDDVICDLEGIVDDRDRRAVRCGVEARQALIVSAGRAAA